MSEVMEKPEVKAVVKASPLKMYKVTINSGEDKAEKEDVVLIHNFRQIQIQRDKEVNINENYLNVLKDAVVQTTVKNDKGDENAVRIPRFSYSVEAV